MATQYTAGLAQGQVLTADIMNQIGAAWETWTPTCSQGGTTLTMTINSAKYGRVNKVVFGECYITVSSGTGTAPGAVAVSLPITAKSGGSSVFAQGFIYDASAAYLYTVTGPNASQTAVSFYYTNNSGNQWGVAPNVALAVNDQIRIQFLYEAN